MKILSADYILSFDEDLSIKENCAIVFDKKIISVASLDEVKKLYHDTKIEYMGKNSVIMPGLINSHIHLEYLANTTTLEYGEFVRWLRSVVKYREELVSRCSDELIENELNNLLSYGTTTIGAISSFGADIEACKNSKINVILFNEVLGSNPATVDMIYQDFLQRYNITKSLKDERFFPAISVHSPYSTHPIVAKKAIELAYHDRVKVQTHFLESKAEREWLDSASGEFKEFLSSFVPNPKPNSSAMEFLKLFDDVDTMFVHATYANDAEIEYINKKDNFIISCPVSNRLLENKKLDIKKVNNLCIATDGLTSNISINLWDELRFSLFVHENIDIDELSKLLLKAVTKDAGRALGLKKGVLKEGYDSDLIVTKVADDFDNLQSIYKWLILHTKKAEKTFVMGEEV